MKRFLLSALICAGVLLAPSAAWAEPVSSVQLVEDPTVWDGRTVTFTGEAIGEAMVRGAEAWLHLNDDVYASGTTDERVRLGGYNSGQAVVIDSDAVAAISTFGDHRHRGDLVEVTGVFNAACPEHGGDMDLHAAGLSIVRPGTAIVQQRHPAKLVALAACALAAIIAAAAFKRGRES
jgi:hypothetical protein